MHGSHERILLQEVYCSYQTSIVCNWTELDKTLYAPSLSNTDATDVFTFALRAVLTMTKVRYHVMAMTMISKTMLRA